MLADATVACEYSGAPLGRPRGGAGREQSRREAASHFGHLADAVDAHSQALFDDYVEWVNVRLLHEYRRTEELDHQLECMATVVHEQMAPPVAAPSVATIEAARADLPAMPPTPASAIDPADRYAPLTREYLRLMLGGFRQAASEIVFNAVQNGEPVQQLYVRVLQPALGEVGRLWQMDKISVAKEHFCSLATEILMSRLVGPDHAVDSRARRAVVCCVGGELHALGARMISDFLAIEGWESYLCGANTPATAICEAVVERGADLVAVSATMGCHVHLVQEVVEALRANSQCGNHADHGGRSCFRGGPIARAHAGRGWHGGRRVRGRRPRREIDFSLRAVRPTRSPSQRDAFQTRCGDTAPCRRSRLATRIADVPNDLCLSTWARCESTWKTARCRCCLLPATKGRQGPEERGTGTVTSRADAGKDLDAEQEQRHIVAASYAAEQTHRTDMRILESKRVRS
jgi:methanogenic corrinoid protein MtbC1